jgi:hypothetical protein
MRITARLMRWCGGRALERDLRDEVEFHIGMRAAGYINEGMAPEDADALARRRFGDEEAVMTDMRWARLTSVPGVLVATTTLSLIVAVVWLYAVAAPVVFPAPALPMKFVKRTPPPPRPGPTWDEFVKKVNTFGDGSPRKPRR